MGGGIFTLPRSPHTQPSILHHPSPCHLPRPRHPLPPATPQHAAMLSMIIRSAGVLAAHEPRGDPARRLLAEEMEAQRLDRIRGVGFYSAREDLQVRALRDLLRMEPVAGIAMHAMPLPRMILDVWLAEVAAEARARSGSGGKGANSGGSSGRGSGGGGSGGGSGMGPGSGGSGGGSSDGTGSSSSCMNGDVTGLSGFGEDDGGRGSGSCTDAGGSGRSGGGSPTGGQPDGVTGGDAGASTSSASANCSGGWRQDELEQVLKADTSEEWCQWVWAHEIAAATNRICGGASSSSAGGRARDGGSSAGNGAPGGARRSEQGEVGHLLLLAAAASLRAKPSQHAALELCAAAAEAAAASLGSAGSRDGTLGQQQAAATRGSSCGGDGCGSAGSGDSGQGDAPWGAAEGALLERLRAACSAVRVELEVRLLSQPKSQQTPDRPDHPDRRRQVQVCASHIELRLVIIMLRALCLGFVLSQRSKGGPAWEDRVPAQLLVLASSVGSVLPVMTQLTKVLTEVRSLLPGVDCASIVDRSDRATAVDCVDRVDQATAFGQRCSRGGHLGGWPVGEDGTVLGSGSCSGRSGGGVCSGKGSGEGAAAGQGFASVGLRLRCEALALVRGFESVVEEQVRVEGCVWSSSFCAVMAGW